MLSRITLHLKKERHRAPQPPATHTTYYHTSQLEGTHRSGIVFDHPDRLAPRRAPVSFLISIQEQSVIHDDCGAVIEVPKKAHPPLEPHAKRASWQGEEEWIEFASHDEEYVREHKNGSDMV